MSACRGLKLAPQLKELRLHLCQKSKPSEGARQFVEKFYVPLKEANPKFPFLIRECSGVQPRLWARYELGKEVSVSLTNMGPEDIYKQVQSMSK